MCFFGAQTVVTAQIKQGVDGGWGGGALLLLLCFNKDRFLRL